ncbi:MAG: FHA domain-containing protein [Prevotellaceae bacterium]|jgi:hypothetical protein|nr:FHA domain-containing protein [Prevotellaceae bacterium]
MAQATQAYKRSLSGSVGAGMGSLLGGSGKQYYILEHKISSKYHKAGEAQEIIIDQVELGRDYKCQVRFDETFETVSRRHAAIIKDGNHWKIVPLSQTNPTILNGRRVQKEWYLQNGDEIQLSVGGPKLGFIIPTGKKSTVGSIGLSRRLSLFRQQALRPYKVAMTVLSILFLLAIGGLSTWTIYGDKKHKEQLGEIERRNIAMADSLKRQHNKVMDSLQTEIAAVKGSLDQVAVMKRDLERKMREIQQRQNAAPQGGTGSAPVVNNAAIEACIPHVFFVHLHTIEFSDGNETETVDVNLFGTGFMLDNGRFVTARHVAEPWFFCADAEGVDQPMLKLNLLAHNGGKVVAHFKAYPNTGEILEFSSDKFTCNRSNDVEKHTEDGFRAMIASPDATDWAYINMNKSGGLPFDNSRSTSLETGTVLTVLGFPRTIGANSPQDIRPVYGNGTVSIQGLNNGVITTTNTNYEQGNSGGPVFYSDGNTLKVIGIVSAGMGRTIGFIVPVSALR